MVLFMEPEKKEPIAYSIRQAAELLGFGKSLAYRMASDGRIPIDIVGKRMVVTPATIAELKERWMK